MSNKSGLNKQQCAETLRGIPVVQLDYETGEYIGEYPSMVKAEIDNDIKDIQLIGAFFQKGSKCCVACLHSRKLMFMKKSAYEMVGADVQIS